MAELLNGIPRVDPTRRPHGWRRALLQVAATKPATALHQKLIAPIDGPLMRLTRGRVNLSLGAMPLMILRTTGAQSGMPRETPLAYFTDGDDVILMASNYGGTKPRAGTTI